MSNGVTPALPDKLGVVVGAEDYVLVAHNGPYLNFGRVIEVETSPRLALQIVEAYQPENDPSKPLQTRRQSICSGHRVVRIARNQIPADIISLLRGV